MPEIKPIPGRPGYHVSDDGKVYADDRGELPQCRSGPKRAYRYVYVGRWRTGVHQLVAAVFVPVPPELEGKKLVVRHRDNDPSNNHADNLLWGTQSDNLADRVAAGTMTWGERNGQAKITEAGVIEIRQRRAAGERCRDIARDFNISFQAAHKIATGLRWAHVGGRVAHRVRASRKESKC